MGSEMCIRDSPDDEGFAGGRASSTAVPSLACRLPASTSAASAGRFIAALGRDCFATLPSAIAAVKLLLCRLLLRKCLCTWRSDLNCRTHSRQHQWTPRSSIIGLLSRRDSIVAVAHTRPGGGGGSEHPHMSP